MTLKRLIKLADDADELAEALADELGVSEDDDAADLLQEIAKALMPNDDEDDEKEDN